MGQGASTAPSQPASHTAARRHHCAPNSRSPMSSGFSLLPLLPPSSTNRHPHPPLTHLQVADEQRLVLPDGRHGLPAAQIGQAPPTLQRTHLHRKQLESSGFGSVVS